MSQQYPRLSIIKEEPISYLVEPFSYEKSMFTSFRHNEDIDLIKE